MATHWPVPAVWLVAGVLTHDLVLIPLLAATGWLLARAVPAPVRPVLRGGLLIAAAITLVALPVLSGKGDPSNASLTPLDYPRNLAIVLAAIAAGTTVAALVQIRRTHRLSPGPLHPTRPALSPEPEAG